MMRNKSSQQLKRKKDFKTTIMMQIARELLSGL
jgi:hypothetical protein